MSKIILTLLLLVNLSLMAQDLPAYNLVNYKSKQVSFKDMTKNLSKADIVFFGEFHTNPISHWLQLEVTKELFDKVGKELILGAEMFENGNQLVIDEYLADFYPEDKMLPEITQLWSNYQTDYKPLLDFAKENKLRFIATNIPRRYAAMINKEGIDVLKKLSPQAKNLIGPDLKKFFDPTIKAYAEMKDKMGGHVPPNMLNIQTAQASKDATMAHFILENYKKRNLFLHFNGSYHSDNRQGIIWWIEKIKPGLEIQSITTINQSEFEKLTEEDLKLLADYIIIVPDNMTQTNR